jgi:hypothetical protein
VLASCLVGRLGEDGPWLGFAPSLDDGYLLVATDGMLTHRMPATPDDLLCLAVAYFEDVLGAPPEDLAATHADIGALVRHVAERVDDGRHPQLAEAVDAIDDGLDGDTVIAALSRCLEPGLDPVERLARRATEASRAG